MEVQVERVVCALAQRLLHGVVVGFGAYGPCVVGVPGCIDEIERDVVWAVGFVQRVELRYGHGVGVASPSRPTEADYMKSV